MIAFLEYKSNLENVRTIQADGNNPDAESLEEAIRRVLEIMSKRPRLLGLWGYGRLCHARQAYKKSISNPIPE